MRRHANQVAVLSRKDNTDPWHAEAPCSEENNGVKSFVFRRSARRIYRPSRSYTTSPPLAFVFDIDGVLLRGEDVLPQGRGVLDVFHSNNPWKSKIPFILMTNGGGMKGSLRATFLSRQLGYEASS
ncbi:hypothetical protein BS47DRAFT_1489138, partial [Hydnum rufescens UP504]